MSRPIRKIIMETFSIHLKRWRTRTEGKFAVLIEKVITRALDEQ